MTSRDVSFHQNNSDFSVSSGRLTLASHSWTSGSDIFGQFTGLQQVRRFFPFSISTFPCQTWKTSTGPAPITTSLRSYLGSDDLDGSPVHSDDSDLVNEDWSEGATIFSQNFPDGLQAAAVKDEDAK